MANTDPQQANRFPREMFPSPNSHLANGHALQNPGVLSAVPADNPQFNTCLNVLAGHGAQGRPSDHQNIVVPDHGMIDHHRGPAIQFANVGHAHDIHAQAQPNAVEAHEHTLFGHAHPVASVPVQATFHDPFGPAPVQPAAERLRRLAGRYLHDPDSQVDLVSMEPGASGRCKVLIVLDVADVL